ncbi:MAG TPA: M56 family metallopeptidase [Thermoanaerobaculia bacterium]|nr:M56 family metallopeptidase [Thermoanaerobaculia bacterium]
MTPVIEIATWLQSLGAIGSFILLLIKATLILAAARLLVAAVPKAPPAVRHIAVTAALCGVLVLPILTWAVPTWSVPVLPAQGEPERRTIGTTGEEGEEPTALDAAITVARATGFVPQEQITAMSQTLDTIRNSWQGLVLIALAGVSTMFLLRIALGVFGVRMVARRAAPIADDEVLRELDAARDHLRLERDVRLLRSSEISVPVVWGLRRPVLLLPASSSAWSAERLRVVLLHELAHVKRGDGMTLLAGRVAVAVFWFHPMMWSLERIARNECERACDDLVLATGARPSDYAEHLLAIARTLPQSDPFRSVTLAMTRRSQLEGRLLSILQPNARRGAFSMRTLSAGMAMALMILVPLASVKLVAAPQENEATPQQEAPEGTVEIGPAIAARINAAPEMIVAGIEKLKRKRSSQPSDGSEWYGRAYELHRSDRYEEAIEAFKQSIAHGHRVAASKYNIACGYALLGDEENAVVWMADAIASGWDDFDHILEDSDLDPIRASARFQQLLASFGDGKAHKHTRRIEKTLDRYDAMRADSSRNGSSWFSIGLDLLRLRKLDESIAAFENAVRLDSKTSTALYNIACAYSLKGDVKSANTYLWRAVENGFDNASKLKNDPDLRNVRSQIRHEELVQLAEDLKLRSGFHGAKSWFFGSGSEAQAWRDTISHYHAVTQKYPQLGRTWFNLGYAQLQAGSNDASAQSFQRALQLGYRPGASTYNTACAYARDRNNDAAFEWLQKARSIGFDLHRYLEDDDDLDNLHGDPRWKELARQVEFEKHYRKSHPDEDEVY